MKDLRGAVALVTGGAGGIGAALAARLRTEGAVVVTTDLAGADHDLDVTDGDAVDAAVARVVAEHGRIDLVATVAGVGVGGLVDEIDVADWQRCIDVNVWGTVHVVRAAYPRFVAQGRGHVLVVSSLAGLVPTPLLVPYATSKGAVLSLALSLRPEAARHGVGVTALCPGPVDTAMLSVSGSGPSARGLDVRRYLERAAGRALTPERLADLAVRGIRKNRAVIVPGQAGMAWRAARLSPRVAEMVVARAMRAELASGS